MKYMNVQVSWAPLSPLGRMVNPEIRVGGAACSLQGQMPWILMTPIFYLLVNRLANRDKTYKVMY